MNSLYNQLATPEGIIDLSHRIFLTRNHILLLLFFLSGRNWKNLKTSTVDCERAPSCSELGWRDWMVGKDASRAKSGIRCVANLVFGSAAIVAISLSVSSRWQGHGGIPVRNRYTNWEYTVNTTIVYQLCSSSWWWNCNCFGWYCNKNKHWAILGYHNDVDGECQMLVLKTVWTEETTESLNLRVYIATCGLKDVYGLAFMESFKSVFKFQFYVKNL